MIFKNFSNFQHCSKYQEVILGIFSKAIFLLIFNNDDSINIIIFFHNTFLINSE